MTVWITGAGSGIGLAFTRLLIDQGFTVYATSRNLASLEGLAEENSNLILLPADLTNAEDLATLKAFFVDKTLDTIVLNAGNCVYMDKAEIDVTAMRSLYEINVFSAVSCVDIAMDALKRSQSGHIIGVLSLSVYLPFTRAAYYGSSKAALSYFLQSLAIDLKPVGIQVSSVYPGFVDTDLTRKNDFAMPFLMSAEKAAEQLHKVLLKKPSRYAFPFAMHSILKGFSCFPALWSKIHKADIGV